ncbi:MAG: glycosyltransferase family 2 protein [Alphaproteobacteria bacterium]|nr:glycosyltransferase family 2 protein [Alphaproteobacteria bacterium]
MDTHSDNVANIGPNIGIVIIGRNEGARLIACLKSAAGDGRRIVYVDSGSTDGSVDAAGALGADVVALDMGRPFTAARARNAGAQRLGAQGAPELIQFVDGDCEIAPGWIETAAAFLSANLEVAIVCGQGREKFPERTIYNRIANREWAAPAGETLFCGGIAMARAQALNIVGGYRDSLIAGEEPELCVRLRVAGWKIHRLDAEMYAHDIAMTALGQWLKRARRAGHAFAEVSHLHRGKPEQIWARETLRAFFWTGLGVAGLLGGAILHPALFFILLAYPLQITRMALRDKPVTADSWAHASLIMMQKPWEAAGALQYWIGRARNRSATLIEHRQ